MNEYVPEVLLNSLTNEGTVKMLQLVPRIIQRAEKCVGNKEF